MIVTSSLVPGERQNQTPSGVELLPQGYLILEDRPFEPHPIGELLMIGSSEDSQFPLRGQGVADRHCRIEWQRGNYLIRDLRSGSATFVNGTQVFDAYLSDGDLLQIGEFHLTFAKQLREDRRTGMLTSRNAAWDYQLALLPNMAVTDFPILLLGPSGTGKEVLSEAIHRHSKRNQFPIVRVNCSALSETLVESELFGHIKGSFTGAIQDRKGAFEAARGGTLFLDEIGDLPLTMQAKLLRALENSEIRPVGSDRTIHTNVRVIAATHQNLKDKMSRGEFRSDLYFRLNVVALHAPKLIERMEDFEDLVYHFAKKMKVRFTFGAIQKLKSHHWPGNIRELKNSVARASALFPGEAISENHLSRIIESNEAQDAGGETMSMNFPVIKEMEKQMILRHLSANHGNQRQTALQLGIPKSTLYDRLRTYQIDARQFSRTNRILN